MKTNPGRTKIFEALLTDLKSDDAALDKLHQLLVRSGKRRATDLEAVRQHQPSARQEVPIEELLGQMAKRVTVNIAFRMDEEECCQQLVAAFAQGRDLDYLWEWLRETENQGSEHGLVEMVLGWLSKHGMDMGERTVQQKRQLWLNLDRYPLFQHLDTRELQDLATRSEAIKQFLDGMTNRPRDAQRPWLHPDFWTHPPDEHLLDTGHERHTLEEVKSILFEGIPLGYCHDDAQ